MILQGYKFEYLGRIDADRNADGSIKLIEPQDRYANVKGLPLNNYGNGPFCKFRMAKGLNSAGVYMVCRDKIILYVGQTINMDKRWSSNGYGGISPRNCFKGGQETNCRINTMIFKSLSAGQTLSLWFHNVENDKFTLDTVEHALIDSLQPIWNKARVA